MRKILALAAASAMVLAMSGCGRSDDTTTGDGGGLKEKGTIGVAMPTKTSQRWIKDGDYIKAELEKAGYKVNLQYANDDIPTQVTQVNDMVTRGNQVLVVASIDGTALAGVLKEAKADGIPVIAYDRLLRSTEAVDYYTTFDNLKVGELQANSLVEGLEASGVPKPWNVELFAGSPDDNNATFFFNGAMEVLQPLIDSGDIVIPSGRDRLQDRRHAALGRGRRQEADGEPADQVVLEQGRQRRARAVRRPVPRHHRGPQGQRLRQRREEAAGRSPARTRRSSRSSRSSPASSTPRCSRTPSDLAKATVTMIQEIAARKEVRSTTPSPTTTASRWSRPSCSTRSRWTRRTSSRSCSTRTTTPRKSWASSSPNHSNSRSVARSRASMAPGHGAGRPQPAAASATRVCTWRTRFSRCGRSPRSSPASRRSPTSTSRSSRGEIHAVCGENGAGKSTLMKVLSGVYPYGTYRGRSSSRAKRCQFKGIRESEDAGIAIIHQELALVPELSITENLFLGNEQRQQRGHRLARRDASGPSSCWRGSASGRTRAPRSRASASASSSSSRSRKPWRSRSSC